MHTTHSNIQYKNESSTVKWAQWDKTQSRELLVCSYVCASHCAQLLHTILHRTDLIVFHLTLQTIAIAPTMTIWGKGELKEESQFTTQHRTVLIIFPLILQIITAQKMSTGGEGHVQHKSHRWKTLEYFTKLKFTLKIFMVYETLHMQEKLRKQNFPN